jgi:type I restriction enzyme S subunit
VTVLDIALGDALEVLIDHRGKTPRKLGGDWVDHGHRVVSALNIKERRVDLNDHHYVDAAMYRRWMPTPLAAGDVLLTSEAPLGEVAYLASTEQWCVGQRLFGLRAKRGLLDGRYLYYLLQTTPVRQQILSRASGSTVLGIRQAELVQVRLKLPSVVEQLQVAATLGALDDKIESNRRLDELCLAIAVERYRAASLKASRRLALGDAGKWLSGGTPSTGDAALWNGDFPWISAGSLKSFHVAVSDRLLTSAGLQQATNVVPAGTVLLVVRGMSLKSELRMGVAQRPVAFGQDVKAIIPTVVPSALLATALYSARDDILELVDEAGHGTGRLQWDLLSAFPIAIPDDERLVPLLDALLARAAAASAESRKLAELRDALLPELLSGRIRVPEAGEAVDSALA